MVISVRDKSYKLDFTRVCKVSVHLVGLVSFFISVHFLLRTLTDARFLL